MAIAFFEHHSMTPVSSSTQQQQQSRPALRRATYVHVSDLTNVYNIDHAKLDQELSRVRTKSEAESETPRIAEGDDDPSGATDADRGLASGPQKRLQPPRAGYNLCVLVGKVVVVVDKKRVDQSRVRLAEVEIGDETGTVSLRARDDQIDTLEEISRRSGAVVLRNCTLELYQGKHIRLAVTKWGKLSVYPDNVASTPPPPSKMNFDRNFSLIDLSVVATQLVDSQPEAPFSIRSNKSSDQGDTGGRSSSSKASGQGQEKQRQSQQSQRRSNRDRRQSRSKATGGSAGHQKQHYSGHHDVAQIASSPGQPGPGQMHYQTIPTFPHIDMRNYPYAHAAQQAQHEQALASASAQQQMTQQMMIQRQYQMQQMYHSQQERHRVGLGQTHQGPGMILPVVTQGSFDTTGEYSVPSYASASGSSPILVPMTMSGGRGVSPVAAGPTQEQLGSAPRGQSEHQTHMGGSGHHQEGETYMSVSPDDRFSPGKMNPDAMAFAPTFMNPQGNPRGTHQLFFPYDSSQHPPGSQPPPGAPYQTSHHHVYNPGMMYVPASQGTPPMGAPDSRPTSSDTGNLQDTKQASKKEDQK